MKGILISFLIKAYTTSPPIADPPIPAMIMLSISTYSFFSVIFSLNTQIENVRSIVMTKDNQLDLSQELSKKLERDLKKQKFKTKLMGGAGILIAVAAAVLVN